MTLLLKYIFFVCFIRPIILLVLGLNVRGSEKLPLKGPTIVVANHNSHLDTMVMMTLFPLATLPHVRPVAAADYFLKTKLMAWFSTKIIGIIPLQRKRSKDGGTLDDRLRGIFDAIEDNKIIILFPEGSRGEPEQLTEFKSGVAYVAEKYPDVPVVPIFLHGLGKALPKGEALLVPFFCDVFIGESFRWEGDRERFMSTLQDRMGGLAAQGSFPEWS